MATETQQKTAETTEAPAGEAPAAKPGAAETTAPAKGEEKPAKPKEAPASAKGGEAPAGGASKATPLKDDDDIPDDAELLTLSPTALKKRLQRATNAELKERFGTTDTDSIKKKLDRLEALEKAEEERRVAALDEKTKAEEKAAKAEERAAKAEAEMKEVKNERVVEKEETRLKDLAGEHVKLKFWKHVARDLAEHLRENYSEKDLVKVKDKDIKKWLGEYVKENPEYAKDFEPEKAGVKKELLDNGAKGDARPGQAGAPNLANKTYKPGQPNSMTPQESKAAMAKEGYRY